MREKVRTLRHWKQQYDPNADFIFRRGLQYGPETFEPGDDIPQALKDNKGKLRRFWEAGWIELALFDEPNVATGQVEGKPLTEKQKKVAEKNRIKDKKKAKAKRKAEAKKKAEAEAKDKAKLEAEAEAEANEESKTDSEDGKDLSSEGDEDAWLEDGDADQAQELSDGETIPEL